MKILACYVYQSGLLVEVEQLGPHEREGWHLVILYPPRTVRTRSRPQCIVTQIQTETCYKKTEPDPLMQRFGPSSEAGNDDSASGCLIASVTATWQPSLLDSTFHIAQDVSPS